MMLIDYSEGQPPIGGDLYEFRFDAGRRLHKPVGIKTITLEDLTGTPKEQEELKQHFERLRQCHGIPQGDKTTYRSVA